MTLKSKTVVTRTATELESIAQKLLHTGARVFFLQGQLGAGKTTFVRGLAKSVGWKQHISSPTFTLMKDYPVTSRAWKKKYDKLVHVDFYRLQDEINPLPIQEWVDDPRTIVAVEWPEKIWRVPGAVEVNIDIRPDETRQVKIIPLK